MFEGYQEQALNAWLNKEAQSIENKSKFKRGLEAASENFIPMVAGVVSGALFGYAQDGNLESMVHGMIRTSGVIGYFGADAIQKGIVARKASVIEYLEKKVNKTINVLKLRRVRTILAGPGYALTGALLTGIVHYFAHTTRKEEAIIFSSFVVAGVVSEALRQRKAIKFENYIEQRGEEIQAERYTGFE